MLKMTRWMAPLAVLFTISGGVAAPAEAQRYNSERYNSQRYNSSYRDQFAERFRAQNYSQRSERHRALAQRAENLARRADRLFRDGRMSREHRDRTFERLERTERLLDEDRSLSTGQYDAEMRWLDRVEDVMGQWSDSDRDRYRDGRNDRVRYNDRYDRDRYDRDGRRPNR